MTGTDPLLAAYVALAALAAAALVASRWPLWRKALLVAGVTGLHFFAAAALDDAWGWPSRQALPERFVLLAVVVDEPAKTSPGALYVWVHPLADGRPAPMPRAYRLAYTKELHALLDESTKKLRQGISQLGSAEPHGGPRGLGWLRPGSAEPKLRLGDLPLPQLPEK